MFVVRVDNFRRFACFAGSLYMYVTKVSILYLL